MFAHHPEIAEPRRIFSGRRSRTPQIALRIAIATAAICAAGYALASALIV
jgi:hypothetical protein